MSRSTRVATTIVGTGRLARALAPLLGPAGYRLVAVVGRRLASARAVCGTRRGARATTRLRRGVEPAQLILLAVADRAVAPVSEQLAALDGIEWNQRVVLHHAGALGLEPLASLRQAGAAVGMMHPLQSLGEAALAREILPGSRARIEGDPRARRAAGQLARGLGLKPLAFGSLSAQQRTAYHAAASLVSNDVLALVAIAADLLQTAGLDRQRATAALLPLVRGTLRQLERAGFAGPLTGPAPRGDVETLRAHLDRLARGDPEDREIHRLLSLRLARLALACGEPAAERTLSELAGRSRRRRV